MSDFIESLWREFEVETEEHLAIIEPLLVDAEGGDAPKDAVAQLFRSFHSIKGLTRAMEMSAMEALTHNAENILGEVRDAGGALSEELAGLLLDVVDELKTLRAEAVANRKETRAPKDLIARLVKTYEGMASDTPKPAPKKAKAAPKPAAPAAGARVAARKGLHQDADMLKYFAELLANELPKTAPLALGGEALDAAARETAVSALQQLEYAAEVMGFVALREQLIELAGYLRDDAPRTPETQDALLALLHDVRGSAMRIEAEIGTDAGGRGLSAALRDSMVRGLADYCQNRAQQRLLDTWGGEDFTAAARAIARMLRVRFDFLECREAARLSLALIDACDRHAQRGAPADEIWCEALRATLTQLFGVPRNWDEGKPVDLTAAEADRIVMTLRHPERGADVDARIQNNVADARKRLEGVGLADEDLAAISEERLDEFADWEAGGEICIHRVDLRPDADRRRLRPVLSWLQDETFILTSRTVEAEGGSGFIFIIATALTHEVFAQALGEVDLLGEVLVLQPPLAPATEEPESAIAETPEPQMAEPEPVIAEDAPAEPADAPAAMEGEAAPAQTGGGSLRVDGAVIDAFMNQIGEMILVRSSLNMAAGDERSRSAMQGLRAQFEKLREAGLISREDAHAGLGALDTLAQHRRSVEQIDQQLQSALNRLQANALELRVVPVDTVFARFPRVVRDLGKTTGKKVRLDLEGREVRIDKGMVDVLVDPLMHMVRNAIDHGLETAEEREAAGKPATGMVRLKAVQKSNQIVIEVSDDGRGMDVETIRARAVARGLVSEEESRSLARDDILAFVFQPGFSTRETVTETSGRGVGMDVVSTAVNRLGGQITMDSELGRGTTARLYLPLSAAIQTALLVEVAGQTVAVPDRFLDEVYEAELDRVQTVKGQRSILLRENFLPIFHLADLIGRPRDEADRERAPLLVLSNGRQRIGVEVERLDRRRELYVKDIHPQLAAIPGVGGAAVLGDGSVMLILDCEDLFRLAEKTEPRRTGAARPANDVAAPKQTSEVA